MLLWRVVLAIFSALALELPPVITTSQKPGISSGPRVTTEADVGSWQAGRPLAEPAGSNNSGRLADSVCYSFPPTIDNDLVKANPPWLFITEIMPLQSAIPKAKKPGKTPPSSSKVKCLDEEQFGAARLQWALRERAETVPKTEP